MVDEPEFVRTFGFFSSTGFTTEFSVETVLVVLPSVEFGAGSVTTASFVLPPFVVAGFLTVPSVPLTGVVDLPLELSSLGIAPFPLFTGGVVLPTSLVTVGTIFGWRSSNGFCPGFLFGEGVLTGSICRPVVLFGMLGFGVGSIRRNPLSYIQALNSGPVNPLRWHSL
ncbi:hypothetical protein D3C86_1584000 [compost metagenome]